MYYYLTNAVYEWTVIYSITQGPPNSVSPRHLDLTYNQTSKWGQESLSNSVNLYHVTSQKVPSQ